MPPWKTCRDFVGDLRAQNNCEFRVVWHNYTWYYPVIREKAADTNACGCINISNNKPKGRDGLGCDDMRLTESER